MKFCNVDDDELREYCIQAFESFVRRCPKEVYPHVPTVISICLRYLTYDPNYNFDDEDEDDNAMDAEQNDEDYQGTQLLVRTGYIWLELQWLTDYFSSCFDHWLIWFEWEKVQILFVPVRDGNTEMFLSSAEWSCSVWY